MGDSVYRVDPRMFVPVVLAIALGAFLIVLEGFTQRGSLLLFLLAPFFYLGAEILARTVTIDSKGMLISKLLRAVSVQWSDIESLDAIQSGSKLFLIIQTEHARPIFITNTIAPFNDLAHRLLEMVPKDKIAESALGLLRDPPSKRGPLVQAWGACLVLAIMVAGKLLGYA